MKLPALRLLSRVALVLITIAQGLVRAAESGPTAIGRWDRFELSVSNSRTYTDPYREVSLEVIYTRPDGRAINFRGFHDSGQTWKLRFMPDQIGTWRFGSDSKAAPP